MENNIPSFLLERPSAMGGDLPGGKFKMPYLEKGINHLAEVISTGYHQWETASGKSIFHSIDPRVKLLFLLFYVVIVSLKRDILSEVYIAGFLFFLTVISRQNILKFYKRVLILGFFFGFLVAAPSALNVITEGNLIFPVIRLRQDYNLWVYHIPAEIGITSEGIKTAVMLSLRVVNSLSLAFLVLYTTHFHDIINALKLMKVPDAFLMVITLSYKYIFVFAKTVEDMHLAKKSRLAGQMRSADARLWAAGRLANIFKKTRLRCEDIFRAMISRGYSDEVRIHDSGKIGSRDLLAGCILFIIGISLLLI